MIQQLSFLAISDARQEIIVRGSLFVIAATPILIKSSVCKLILLLSKKWFIGASINTLCSSSRHKFPVCSGLAAVLLSDLTESVFV